MQVISPKYYQDFCCIADRCSHSCCIGWEIDIDSDTMQKYDALNSNIGITIRESIDKDGTPHFRLCEEERCPHLDDRGLCKIILELGDGYLCDICREHPRFYNETPLGLEVGLGMACEEACRIILCSDDYDSMIVIGDEDIDCDIDFNTLPHRERIFDILKDIFLHYSYKLHKISVLYDAPISTISDEEYRGLLGRLEYLDDTHKALFSVYSSDVSHSDEDFSHLERALAYFVYRHVTPAQSEEDLRRRIQFCLFCERLLGSIIAHTDTDVFTAARIISEEIEYSEENTQAILNMFT